MDGLRQHQVRKLSEALAAAHHQAAALEICTVFDTSEVIREAIDANTALRAYLEHEILTRLHAEHAARILEQTLRLRARRLLAKASAESAAGAQPATVFGSPQPTVPVAGCDNAGAEPA